MHKVTIYTDGASKFNGTDHAVGGWSAILIYGNVRKPISGGEMLATNNQMELRAVIEGVRALKVPCEVEVYTDSTYIVGNSARIRAWRSNGWKKTKSNAAPKNLDLWQELIKVGLEGKHKISFHKVPAHAGNELNEACDRLAKKAAETTMIRNGWRV
jgi:ribonuclease HI